MNPNNLRVAIIGCGDIAGRYDETSNDSGIYSHAGAYQSCEIPITAAVEPDANRLNDFVRYWRVKSGHKQLSEILIDKPFDIISVCTPDSTHHSIIKEIISIQPPKIIWTEKPLATNFRDAREIVALAAEQGVGLRVTYHRRWEPVHQRIKSFIKEGRLGQVVAAHGYYVKGIIHIGTSAIDTLRFLIGEVKDAWMFPGLGRGSKPEDPSAGMLLQMENGCQATILGADAEEYTYSLFEVDIIGSHGRVRFSQNGDLCELYDLVPYGHYANFYELKPVQRIKTEMPYAIKYGLHSMLASLNDGTWSDISEGKNALKNIEITCKAKKIEQIECQQDQV